MAEADTNQPAQEGGWDKPAPAAPRGDASWDMPNNPPAFDPWIRRARLERVVDGDTAIMLVDLGYNVRGQHSIRFMGVDAPEKFSGPPEERDRGRQATRFVEEWFSTHQFHMAGNVGWPFIIRSEKDHQTFGRYIGDIYCQQGHSLAQALVEAGQAVPDGPGSHSPGGDGNDTPRGDNDSWG